MSHSKNKLLNGVLWSIIEIFIKRIFDLLIKLIFARLLMPEDFGVIGMATVFISFIQVINDGGMISALIQRKKELLDDAHFQTAFWTSIFWSIFLYLLMVLFITPFAVYFYKTPILAKIIPLLSISLLASSINIVNRAQLLRELRFKELAFINNTSSIIAGVIAIVLAFSGVGIWALVFYTVIPYIIMIPLLFKATKWYPRFEWNKKYFKEIFSFGIFTSGSQIINNISANIDYLIIGKIFNAAILGSYSLAILLTNTVKSQITSLFNRVMFPFYSSIQTDLDKLKTFYLQLLKYCSFLISFIMLILIMLGGPLVELLFGYKWGLTIYPMKILAIAVIVDIITCDYNLLFRSTGQAKLEMKIQIGIALCFYIPGVLIGAYINGIIGVAYGILISKIVSFILIQFLLKHFFEISIRDIFNSIKATIIALVTTFILIYPFIYMNLINLYISFVFIILIYGGIGIIFFQHETDFIIQRLKKLKMKNKHG